MTDTRSPSPGFAIVRVDEALDQLFCPVCGDAVLAGEGFDGSACEHVWFVVSEDSELQLPDEEGLDARGMDIMRRIEAAWEGGDARTVDEAVTAIAQVLPPSALVMRFEEPAQPDGQAGSSFFVAFDFGGTRPPAEGDEVRD